MTQNKEEAELQELLQRRIYALQKDIDSIMSIIIKSSFDALVSSLNDLDEQKRELTRQLHKMQTECSVDGLSEEELSKSFKQVREMLRTGELPTVKALVERYVQRVILSEKHIEI